MFVFIRTKASSFRATKQDESSNGIYLKTSVRTNWYEVFIPKHMSRSNLRVEDACWGRPDTFGYASLRWIMSSRR